MDTIGDVIKTKIERADSSVFFYALLWVALVIALHFGYTFLHADRTPKGYYLYSFGTSAGIAYKIKVSINYMDDPVAFTTPDYKVALKTLKELNSQ